MNACRSGRTSSYSRSNFYVNWTAGDSCSGIVLLLLTTLAIVSPSRADAIHRESDAVLCPMRAARVRDATDWSDWNGWPDSVAPVLMWRCRRAKTADGTDAEPVWNWHFEVRARGAAPVTFQWALGNTDAECQAAPFINQWTTPSNGSAYGNDYYSRDGHDFHIKFNVVGKVPALPRTSKPSTQPDSTFANTVSAMSTSVHTDIARSLPRTGTQLTNFDTIATRVLHHQSVYMVLLPQGGSQILQSLDSFVDTSSHGGELPNRNTNDEAQYRRDYIETLRRVVEQLQSGSHPINVKFYMDKPIPLRNNANTGGSRG